MAAIALSGQMQDVILVRHDGTVLGPCILYCDSRAKEEARAIESQFGEDFLCRETGHTAMQHPTEAQVLMDRL